MFQTVISHDYFLGQRTLNKPKHRVLIQCWRFFGVVPNGNKQWNEIEPGIGMCKCLEIIHRFPHPKCFLLWELNESSRVGFRHRMNFSICFRMMRARGHLQTGMGPEGR